jgi:hypothetical protein
MMMANWNRNMLLQLVFNKQVLCLMGTYSFVCTHNATGRIALSCVLNLYKVQVKSTPVQALRLCTGSTARRGSRGIALLYRH